MERVSKLTFSAKFIKSNINLNMNLKKKLIRGYKRIIAKKKKDSFPLLPSNFEQFSTEVYAKGHVNVGSGFAPGGGCLPLDMESVMNIAQTFNSDYEKYVVSEEENHITIVWVFLIYLFREIII
jgi:hypothetical protein